MKDQSTQSIPRAVIDIGSTSIRMIIAQVLPKGQIKTLEFLHQAVTLGRDTFTKGYITHESIEDCVATVKSFRKVLDEYQVNLQQHFRAIATTAVREAENCDAFIDRVAIATGITIDIIDDGDIARCIFLSLQAHLATHKPLLKKNVLLSEMSGGSSFILFLEKGDIQFARTHRLGTLRTHEMVELAGTPDTLQGKVTKSHIEHTIDTMIDKSLITGADHLIALGGDITFAAGQILSSPDRQAPNLLPVSKLSKFITRLNALTVENCMSKYKLSYADAESIGPALLYYRALAQALHLKELWTSPISMRHGLLLEMSGRETWSGLLEKQIIRSVIATGRKYDFEENHAKQIAYLSSILFKELHKEHGLEPWNELLLLVAAYLHNIGLFINSSGHHKHSMYLIQNSDLFGLSKKEVLLASLIARYHRRATPKNTHIGFSTLDRHDRLIVTKLAAILRVADSLDRTNTQQIQNIHCTHKDNQCILTVKTSADLYLEEMALKNKSGLFTEVYGMQIILRKKRK